MYWSLIDQARQASTFKVIRSIATLEWKCEHKVPTMITAIVVVGVGIPVRVQAAYLQVIVLPILSKVPVESTRENLVLQKFMWRRGNFVFDKSRTSVR